MIFVSMSKALYQPPPSSQHCWLLLQGKLQALVCRTAALGRKVPLAMVARVAENPPFQPCPQAGWERQQCWQGTHCLEHPCHSSSTQAQAQLV